jgi:hypothetical protein
MLEIVKRTITGIGCLNGGGREEEVDEGHAAAIQTRVTSSVTHARHTSSSMAVGDELCVGESLASAMGFGWRRGKWSW